MAIVRRMTVISGSLIGSIAMLVIAMFAGGVVTTLMGRRFPPGVPGTNVQGGELGSVFYFSVLLFAIALAISSIVIFWRPLPHLSRRAILFFGPMLLLLIISWVNFIHNDELVPYSLQAVTNVIMAFLSTVAILDLIAIHHEENALRALRAFAIGLLFALGVVLPLLFNAAWLAHQLGISVRLNSELLALQRVGQSAVRIIHSSRRHRARPLPPEGARRHGAHAPGAEQGGGAGVQHSGQRMLRGWRAASVTSTATMR
jgi:hypothetical protein